MSARRTVRNPMFWADVVIPLFDQMKLGETTVGVLLDRRGGEEPGSEVELEVRVVRVGKTRIPKTPLRVSHYLAMLEKKS